MEEVSHSYFSGPEEPHKVAIVSIAISLKRIADALSYSPEGPTNLFDLLANALHDKDPQAGRTL